MLKETNKRMLLIFCRIYKTYQMKIKYLNKIKIMIKILFKNYNKSYKTLYN